MRRAIALLAGIAAAGCGDDPLPFGEIVVIVDADMPVPRAASRLRVDLYAEDGNWFESRDIARPDPRDWPLSFSVFSEHEQRDDLVWVRLRVYPEGRVRDYQGERFVDWGGASLTPPPGDGEPRLIHDGIDVTPPGEPEPLVTVERLLLLRLEPGVVGQARVTMHALCAGTMAISSSGAPHQPVIGQAQSCVATEQQREPVVEAAIDARSDDGVAHLDALTMGCAGAADPERVCISGGVDVLGSIEVGLYPDMPPVPERIALHPPYWVDREELTVGRYREALALGFAPSNPPEQNDGPLGTDVSDTCTWSASDLGRERYALSCVSWQTARELCQFFGGDLPTEAQWERMARLAGERGPSLYPWGDEKPSCDRAVYGRLALAGSPGACQQLGSGPLPVDASAEDVTPQGVIGVAGGVSEWLLDSYQSYESACWAQSPVVSPRCVEDNAALRTVRGAGWAAPPAYLASAQRVGSLPLNEQSVIGVRCAYPAEPAVP